MDGKYRLIFRGEILEGQHRAVVKRRLAEALKLDEARLETLFSGKPVVLKRDVDRKTAARYQAVFKKAGGQLRVKAEQPQGGETPPPAQEPARSSGAPPVTPPIAEAPGNTTWHAAIDAPDFEVQSAYFSTPDEPRPEIEAPDFPVADVGSNMADKVEVQASVVAEVNFDLAEAGADLLTEGTKAVVVDVGSLDFDLAEVGADLGPGSHKETAAAPDVSHLAIIEP